MRPHSLIWHIDNALAQWMGEWVEYLMARKAARARAAQAKINLT